MRFSKKIVILSFVLLGLFTVYVLYINQIGGSVSDTLIEWVFKFFGMEMLALAGVSIPKNINKIFKDGDD